jgi:D-lyxose ketol-isomerase
MKRSEINAILREAMDLVKKYGLALPPFADWTPEQWQEKGHACDEIRDNMLGWDVTDHGLGKFDKIGLTLFTIRNGSQKDKEKYPKPYAEKLLIVREGQVCPLHFHWSKMEDIINRAGGIMMMQLYNSLPDGELDRTGDVTYVSDGTVYTVPAGSIIEFKTGESITLRQGMYHSFWAKEGCGTTMIGEVSMCNDDETDNRYYEKMGRFPEIEEDEAPLRYLCTEYPKAK